MKIKSIINLLSICAILIISAGTLPAQSVAGTDTNLNLSLDVKGTAGALGNDAWTAIKGLNFSQGINGGLFGVRDGAQYGVGAEISTAMTNSPIQAGFAVLALEQPDGGWAFYDSSFNLSISTHEQIPVINMPVDLIIGSGPGVRYLHGATLIEQSFAFGEIHWRLTSKFVLDGGIGVIHISDKAKALPAANIALTYGKGVSSQLSDNRNANAWATQAFNRRNEYKF